MSLNILKPEAAGNLWPLNENQGIADQLIAGSTFREWQEKYAPPEANLLDNAWVDPQDWDRIKTGGILTSEKGEILARIGEDETQHIASDLSRLILHPWDFIYVNEQIVKNLTESNYIGEVSPAAHVEGVLIVGKGTRILPGVFIEGNVVIGENCKVGPNCYIRGNTSIGDGCHIGQAVEIKNSIIGHGSSVGHLSYVGDSILGNKVNFGAATVTSNLRHDGLNHRSMTNEGLVDTGRRKFGTIVGDNVHTGIHTAIYPGRKLGPNTSTRPNQDVQKDLI